MRFLFDEDFDRDIFTALRRRLPNTQLVRVQDVGLRTQSDTAVLEWAGEHGYVLVTHDRRTMFGHFAERMAQGKASPGIIIVKRDVRLGIIMFELELLLTAGRPDDFFNNVILVP